MKLNKILYSSLLLGATLAPIATISVHALSPNPNEDYKTAQKAGLLPHDKVINKDARTGDTINPDTNFKLYWFAGEKQQGDQTIRKWNNKADGIYITKDMQYSTEGKTKVVNFTTDDVPQYLPESTTHFTQDYNYEGEDWVPVWNTETKELYTVRFWSKKTNTSQYGATTAYTRYDATKAVLHNATVKDSTNLESTAIEASNHSYTELSGNKSAIDFKATTSGNGLTTRFTVPDGQTGTVDVKVNGKKVASLDLQSKWAWQYVDGDNVYDNATSSSKARFRFDEVHTLLKDIIKAGDTVTIENTSNTKIGIDFIELEQAPDVISQPENSISITDKGAVANDGKDDSKALEDALYEASVTGKNVYIPAGTFTFDKKIAIFRSNVKIQGAGMWYTNLQFTSDKENGGGFSIEQGTNNVEFSDFYMSSNLTSRYNEKAQYKAFAGPMGQNAKFNNLWIEHFECGFWVGDYASAPNMTYTDNLVIENSRIRNNLADGVNFVQGTKNSKVINSNIRGNGDDQLASWASINPGSESAITENNKFLNNTIELGWRAAGVGIFGGKGHEIAGNDIKDNFSGAGIRVNTVFDGHNFDLNTTGINIHNNKLERTGTTDDFYGNKRGSIDFERVKGDIRNVNVFDNQIVNPYTSDYTQNFNLTNDGNSVTIR